MIVQFELQKLLTKLTVTLIICVLPVEINTNFRNKPYTTLITSVNYHGVVYVIIVVQGIQNAIVFARTIDKGTVSQRGGCPDIPFVNIGVKQAVMICQIIF